MWEPCDGPDWASMSLECVLRWTSGCEEIVNMDEVYKHASKKMATVREYDLTTLLDLDVFVLKNFFLEDIHHANAIEEANDYLESGWMERYGHGIILELLINHQLKAERWAVAPDLDGLVGRARRNQVFLHADIHAGDGSRMKSLDEVEVESLYLCLVHQAYSHLVYLVVVRCEDQHILS